MLRIYRNGDDIINKLDISKKTNDKIFESIKHIDSNGCEYWFARELQKVLEYKDWRNFRKVIDKAVLSAKNSVSNKEDWVVEVNKPIKTGKGKEETIKDYKLSRYICYLIVQNADSKKTFVAESQVGLGFGGTVGVGSAKAQVEASKGFGWGYRSDTGNYEFTSNSIGATTDVFEREDLEFGLGAELRNYDKYTNPMIMPWEVWDSENTTKETTIGLNRGNTAGEGAHEYNSKSDTVFIGIDLSGYIFAGGEIKIGWELEF